MFSYHLSLKNIIFFLLQLLGGFVSFLFPKLPDAMRAEYLKVHVFFGVFIFALAVGTCLMGIVEKLFFSKYVTISVCLAFILRPYLTGPVIWLIYQSNQSFNIPGHLMPFPALGRLRFDHLSLPKGREFDQHSKRLGNLIVCLVMHTTKMLYVQTKPYFYIRVLLIII